MFDRRLTLNFDMQKQNVGEYHEIIAYATLYLICWDVCTVYAYKNTLTYFVNIINEFFRLMNTK